MNPTPNPLQHLVSSLGSSLAMYVADAGIWAYPGVEEIKLALADLVDDHRSLVERAGAMLEDRGADVPRHPYPIRFTATHDLDLAALLPRIIAGLKMQIVDLETCLPETAATGSDVAASDLVREAITSTRAHIDALEQVLTRPRAPTG